jgi:AcrR family transcriptional regulator
MSATSGSTPKRSRREETRERLIEAAISVLARQGYERATVDQIVGEAGFSKGAFYVHFQAKEDVFWAILDERISRQQDAFLRAVDPAQPIIESIKAILTGLFALDKNDPHWVSLIVEFAAHAARDERVREQISAMYRRWRGLTIEALAAGQRAGQVRTDIDVEFAASILISIVEGSMLQSRVAPDLVRLDAAIEPLAGMIGGWLKPD